MPKLEKHQLSFSGRRWTEPDMVSNPYFLCFCISTISDSEQDANGLEQGLGDASNLVSSILKSSPTYLYKMLLQHKNACFLIGSSQLK